MVQSPDQGHELEDNTLNPYYYDQSGYRIKISRFNDNNIVVLLQAVRGKSESVDTKHGASFSNLTNQLRILIVESEPDIRLLFKSYLELVGAESITADNGDKAICIFQEGKNQGRNYDVVLIDTHLKGRLGIDVAKKIHSDSQNQRIVLLTTYMKEELSQTALDSAAINDRDILVMPFKLAQLLPVLNP